MGVKASGGAGATFRVKGRMSRSVQSYNFHATIAQASLNRRSYHHNHYGVGGGPKQFQLSKL